MSFLSLRVALTLLGSPSRASQSSDAEVSTLPLARPPSPSPRRLRSPWGHREGVKLRAPTWLAAALVPAPLKL